MKTSRISAAIVSTLAITAAGHARAQSAEGGTVRLDTVQKLWVAGDDIGPKRDGLPRVGKNTGAGIMDTNFTFDRTAAAKANYGTEVLIGTTYTRSSNQRNNDDSYMQGGFALGKVTAEKGVELGAPIDLPQLEGERAFMRPLIAFTNKYAVLIAASEDNNSNNGNPKPVMFLADKTSGQLVKIANNTRGDRLDKPTDLITQAQRDGISVDGANNQRGPHMIVPVSDNSFLVGMQYNNQAQEVFRVTINEDGAAPSVKMNWLRRYEDDAVHNRPQVAYTQGATEGYMTAVECNAQPANIAVTLTKFDVASGREIARKRVVRADPGKNKYVAEPSIADMGDTVAIGFALSAKVRDRNGNNGHAGGANVSQLVLVNKADLSTKGDIMVAPANYQRHAHIFGTHYGPNGEPAVAVISGSSTGTGKGLLQMVPLTAEGTLGTKDPLKMYTVSTYSDVANLQARGKRNPNNQAKGFINGLGDLPNPGFDKAGGFYPEVKTFSLSAVTGYSSAAAKDVGKRESLWLSLVPSTWKPGLKTAPGVPSETAGNGPAPRTTDPATDPAAVPAGGTGEENVLDGTEATRPGEASGGPGGNARGPQFGGETEAGCAVAPTSRSSVAGTGLLALAVAGALLAMGKTKKREAE
jgi:hypothetical protein